VGFLIDTELWIAIERGFAHEPVRIAEKAIAPPFKADPLFDPYLDSVPQRA
jgi:hypothetical protein